MNAPTPIPSAATPVPPYKHTPLFPLGKDTTTYRKLTSDGVRVEKVLGKVGVGDVTVACWEPGQICAYHCHPEATEVYFCFQGGGKMRTAERTIDIVPGGFVVHPPGELHEYINGPQRTLLFRVRYGKAMTSRGASCAPRRAASSTPLSVSLGKVKPPTASRLSPPSQETYPRCTRLPFCGYRKHALVSDSPLPDSSARLPSAAAL